MKHRLFMFLSFASMLSLVGCTRVPSSSSTATDEVYEIYLKAKEAGYSDTYQNWLASIKGEKGETGDAGNKGEAGDNGKSIVSVIKTGSEGAVDTYTITFSDGSTYEFTVANGEDENFIYDGTDGLEFYLQNDDTYLVSSGTADDLSEVVVPATYCGKPVVGVRESGFYSCDVESIVLPEGLTSIGSYAFDQSDLESISIPDTISYIGPAAFRDCKLNFSATQDGVYYLGNDHNSFAVLFGVDEAEEASVTIPSGVKYVCQYAFTGISALTHVTIEDGLTTLGVAMFKECGQLLDIALPNTLTRIEKLAFKSCASLTAISLPASVTSIGEEAFSGCSALTSLAYEGTMDQFGQITLETDWNKEAGFISVVCSDGTVTL